MIGVDGVGEAVTGGMLAQAVEPAAGGGPRDHEGEIGGACLNCGTLLDGPFCKACGQRAHVHRSVAAVAHDIVHGVLHLDGKLWRTLPLLVWRPGDLTRRYAHGERAKFVSPMAMFLFSVFLMFAMLSLYGLSLTSLDINSDGRARQGLEVARTQVARELAEARQARDALARGTPARVEGRIVTPAQLDRRIADLQEQSTGITRLERGMATLMTPEGGARTGWERLDHGIAKFSENPSLALYKLQSNGYKFSWLLIPLSVPFVWLLFFWTRRYHFYDHAVFVTYSLSFMSLFAILLTVAGFAGVNSVITAFAAIFVPPIHMFRQLKQAYGLHWASALLRTFLLVNFCVVTAGLFFILLLGIGALG
jgi:hypothetical protein